jgi:hypothetical protein
LAAIETQRQGNAMNRQAINSSVGPATGTAPEWPPRTQAERDRLRDDALERAHELRSEAIADFWRGTDQWMAEAVDQTRRAADRLAARLRQHAKQRGSAASHKHAVEA